MEAPWLPAADRYGTMAYRRCGRSGLDLPAISLGLWQNFGDVDRLDVARTVIRRAVDSGVTHFDLANNYGPPYGSAEINFGRILADDLRPVRDELVISTKAGFDMWPGPYGDWGSRKHLIASLDQSLRRLRLDHVDIFYHHRPDPRTPLEETMAALDHVVRSGKALYVGLSNYPADRTAEAVAELRRLGTPCLIHQTRYSMLDRAIEPDLLRLLAAEGVGCIAYSPLAQGLLTDKYLGDSVPEGSRMSRSPFLAPSHLTPELRARLRRLAAIARRRGQSLARMALQWVLRDGRVTSALIGARDPAQLDDSLAALGDPPQASDELAEIEAVLAGA